MIIILVAAIVTVCAVGWLVHPLMVSGGGREQRIGISIILGVPLLALSFYLWLGMPDLPSAAALFEREGPHAELRALARDELQLTQKLSQDPENEDLKAELGQIFYARGLAVLTHENDPERAASYLDNALSIAPKDAPYRNQLQSDRKRLKSF